METQKLTNLQAFKFLWSMMWRTWVLMLPLAVVWGVFLGLVIGFPKPGQPPPHINPAIFFPAWLIIMGGFIFFQLQALRWVFKCKWSDFELKIISKTKSPAESKT